MIGSTIRPANGVDKSKKPGIFGLAAKGSNDNDTVIFFSDKNGNNIQELEP